MEIDVSSPTSTCPSEVSFSVESSEESSEEESFDSCVICFCSDEETESHDCTVCKEGAWKICKKCKERLKRIDKCPVCMTENLNYEEPTPPRPQRQFRPQRQQNVVVRQRNPLLIELILQGLWKDLLLEICVCIFKLCVCILYSIVGFSTVLMIAHSTHTTQCFLQLFIAVLMAIIFAIASITLFYDPREEGGRLYRICIAPLLSIMLLTFSGLINKLCFVIFVGKTEVLIIGGICLLCYSCFVGKLLIDGEIT